MNKLWYEEMNKIFGELAKDEETEVLYHVERDGHVELVARTTSLESPEQIRRIQERYKDKE